MDYKDYYSVLGVSKTASAEDIKRAYRKLARQYHPDVSKEANAAERFKEVNEANQVLSDPEKRKAYDQLGANWKQGQGFEPPPGWDPSQFRSQGFQAEDASQFSDFFSSLFGEQGFQFHQQGRPRHRKGEDWTARVAISLEDAIAGATKTIEIPTGHELKTLRVKIPAGVMAGQKIRLQGQGHPGSHGLPAGDLYLEIEFQAHPFYKVVGKDLYVTLPVTPWEAALGATVTVPTLSGKVQLKIPPESQSGQKLRLRGKGIGKEAGDEYVVLQVVLPPATSEKAKQCYQKMAEELPFNPRDAKEFS